MQQYIQTTSLRVAIALLCVSGLFATVTSAEARSRRSSESRVSGDPGGHSKKGVKYARNKEYDKALAEFSEAIEAQPQDPKNYINRGTVYRMTGKTEQARKDFDKAISLNPKNADAYVGRAQAELQRNKRKPAMEDLTKAIQLEPKNGTALRFRAYAHLQKKEWAKAIEDYTVAINSVRRIDIEGRTRRGFAYRNLGQYDKAVEDFTKVIEAAPKNAQAYRRRAYAYAMLKQNDKAVADLKKVLQLKPGDKDALARLKAIQQNPAGTPAPDNEDVTADTVDGATASASPSTAPPRCIRQGKEETDYVINVSRTKLQRAAYFDASNRPDNDNKRGVTESPIARA